MKIKKIGVVVIVTLLIAIIAGCSQKVSQNDVKFANNMVENMLIAENNDDHTEFTENLSSSLKKAYSKEEMNKQEKIIKGKIGDYIPNSKKFKQAVSVSQKNREFIVVIYDVKFKNEKGETTVTATFDDDNKHEVEGFIISSPKLMGK